MAGGVYGSHITFGKPVYYRYDGSRTRGIILISDGGKYGLDQVTGFEYKSVPLVEGDDYVFHRGTFTKQITPYTVTVNSTTDVVNHTAHPYNNNDPVRMRSVDGNLPTPLAIGILGQSVKVWVVNKTTDTYQLSSTDPATSTTLIDFTDTGTGTLKIWKADAGFDDPDQGLPTFCPETETTFNNIAYIEFKLPVSRSSATEQPDWEDFRILLVGRRLMDYDEDGNELGVIEDDEDLLGNTPLQMIDNLLWNYKVKAERIDWSSWKDLRDSADVEIFQRIQTDEDSTDTGLSARYYQNDDFTNLVLAKVDTNINIPDTAPSTPPASGVSGYGFSVIWKGRIKPQYSELYTLKFIHDNEVDLYINGNLILSQTAVGTHTTTYTFVANTLYEIEVRFRQIYLNNPANHYRCQFYWSSASQTEQIVPQSRLFVSDEIVKRYRTSMAFVTATEASEVHERLMERMPGWDWTDDEGLIKFLAPNREPVFTFRYDILDNDSIANFANKSFEKKRRGLPDRKNFLLGYYRNALLTGYPKAFVQADRENLREFTNGEPTNDPAQELGVMTRSLAERMLENQMVFNADPDHTATLDGGLSASALRKCQKVLVEYYDQDNNLVADDEYILTLCSWGANNNRQKFNLLPLTRNFYSDEPVES